MLPMKAVNKKNDVLKSLIQKVELDKPTPNFTALVMEEVAAQNEIVINPALKSLLKRNGIEKPSVGFTHSIMSQVEGCDFKPAYKPIISKKAWRIIIAAAVFFFLCLGYSEHASTSPGGLTPYFINIGNTLNTIFTKVNSVPSLYLITFISLSALLVLDYLLRIRGQSHEKKSQTFLQ
jgi:hypothetical protein